MSNEDGWPKLFYHPVQYKLWTTKSRFAYVCAGRQSGKTELALRRLVRYLPLRTKWDNAKYIYSSPTYNQAKKVAWDRLLELIPNFWKKDVSVSELKIKTIFGSELFLVGLDQAHRLEGQTISGIVVDENSDIKPGTFDLSILPTLIWTKGWAWRIGIPKRYGVGAVEFQKKYFQAAKGQLPDSEAYTWVSAGIVPKEHLKNAKDTMSERDYDEQFCATWVNASGGVFYAWEEEYNVRPCLYDPGLPILVSSDFNVDPMVWILAHNKGDRLEVFDEIFLRNTNTEATIKHLLNKYRTHKNGFQLFGDASGKARKTSASQSDYIQLSSNLELKKLGRSMHYTTSNPAVADRFAATNARIKDGAGNRHIFVDPKCENLIYDLLSRTYKPGTRTVDDTQDQGHATDALGYLVHKLWAIKIEIPISNKVFIRR